MMDRNSNVNSCLEGSSKILAAMCRMQPCAWRVMPPRIYRHRPGAKKPAAQAANTNILRRTPDTRLTLAEVAATMRVMRAA